MPGTSAHPPGGNLGTFSLIFQPGINTQPRETELQLWPTGTDPILQKTDTSHTTASKRQHKSLKSSKQPKISNLTLIPVGNFLCKHTHTQRQTNKKAILLCQFYPKTPSGMCMEDTAPTPATTILAIRSLICINLHLSRKILPKRCAFPQTPLMQQVSARLHPMCTRGFFK